MNIRLALGAVSLAVLTACGGGESSPPAPSSNETTRIVAFGDSLTDGGTYTKFAQAAVAQATGGAITAAPVGKFTNSAGAVWVEVLAGKLGTTIVNERFEYGSSFPVSAQISSAANATNYAQGGSRVAKQPGIGCSPNAAGACTGATAVPVVQQVDRALAKGSFTATDLVVFWGGNNDVFHNLALAGPEITAAVTAATLAGQSAAQIAALQQAIAGKYVIEMEQAALALLEQTRRARAAGAQRIVVLTLPDSAKSPMGQSAQVGASGRTLMSTFVKAFNDQLKKELALMDTGVMLFDAAALSAQYYDNPAANGFTNIAVPVCDPAKTNNTSLVCFEIPGVFSTYFPAAVAPAATSLFADGVHPTVTSHAKFGNAVYEALKTKGWVR
ncbi:SGNH/GDSL hydrolase family protein [Roseateles cavernae]|uniref:SGNH/GDSL hydrolase family protein n=1 Tax=Roseateles cavernae TaxID=3153578 RepID=UPI0032E396FE